MLHNLKFITFPFFYSTVVLLCTSLLSYSGKMILNEHEKNTESVSKPITIQLKNTSPSIVELFTSEGCSSCPAADKLIAQAQNEFGENTVVLSYHVDYWDRLGWKDPFSKSSYSERQRMYAQHFNLESVYTPQAIVNGKGQFVGSDKNALWKAINEYKNENSNSFVVEVQPPNSNKLLINYQYPTLQKNEQMVVELVLKTATTQVKRGENGGATLNHIHIVQDIIQKNEANGMAAFTIPQNFVKENYIIVCFVQNIKTLEITDAKMTAIAQEII